MWAALALTTVLTAPAQAGELKVSNVRSTYGFLGSTRKDKDLLPGDVLALAFDVENLTVKPDGLISFSQGVELIKKGKPKPEFKRDPEDVQTVNTLGGTTMPSVAFTAIGVDTPEGEYTFKVTIKDRGSKPAKTVVVEETFRVKKVELGFVQMRFINDQLGAAPPIGVPGQHVHLHYALVGYTLDSKKNPNLTIEMQVLDKDDKPTLEKPLLKGDIVKDSATPGLMLFTPAVIHFNRVGKFKARLKATDNLTKTTTEQTIDFEVVGK